MISVLYVDDEETLLELGKQYLERTKEFSVTTASSTSAALALLQSREVQAIVSDYQMPEMDGIEFLKAIRARGDKTPFIIFTGKGREEVVIEALNSGADFYLQKGGEPKSQFAELMHKIRTAVERRSTERDLKDSREQLSEIIGFLPDATLVIDNDKRVIIWNHATEEMTGIPAPDIIGKGNDAYSVPFYGNARPLLMDLLFEPDHIIAQNYPGFQREGENLVIETFCPALYGGRGAYVAAKASPLRDSSGQIFGAIESIRDVTKQKKAEDALQQSEERLAVAIEGAYLGLWDIDYTNRTIRHNQYWNEVLGYDAKETITPLDSWKSVIHHDDLPLTELRTYEHLDGKTPVLDMEYRIRHKDGRWLWIHTIGKVVSRGADGKPLRMSGINQDITDRRKAEEKIRESEEFSRAVISNAMEGIIVYDRELRITLWNTFMERLTGLPAHDVVGKNAIEQFPFHIKTGVARLLEQALSGISSESSDFPFFIQATGRKGWVKGLYSPHYDAGGTIIGVIGIVRDITRRKRAEEALLESRERLEFAIEGAHLGLWDMDYTNLTIRHNGYWNEVLGYGPEETVRSVDWWRQTLHPDDLPMIDAASRDHLGKKTPVLDIEYRIRHKDGHWLWIHTIGKVVSRSADGEPLRMSGINQDITGRKLAEEALKESERKFREIFNKANDAIHLHEIGKDGRPGKFTDVNDVACERLQYSRDEMLQRGPLDFSTEYHSRPLDKILEELRTVGHATFETGHIRKDGTIVPVEINAHLITLSGGDVVLSVVRDITDRKKGEEALRGSERKFRNFFETSHDAVFITSTDGKLVDVNEAFIDMFGYDSKEEILKVNVADFYANPDERDKHIRTIAEMGHTKEYPVNVHKKDGTIIHTLVSSVPWKDGDGRLIGFQGTIRDITERKRAEEDLHKMSTAIAEANKKLNLLSSITRHDILNQLTALQGYLELSHDIVDDPKTLLSFIEKEEIAAATIAEQITFTREYQDLGVSAPVWQNVSESIRNAVAGLPVRAVRVEVDRTDLEIFADPLFDKVFYNLIDNALRYGGAGMKALRVLSRESENGLTIVCEDDGVGISDDDKKHLFTRGFGKHTGLGLFLTREILGITGITIAENGIPGKGARFEITVPEGEYRLTDAGKK